MTSNKPNLESVLRSASRKAALRRARVVVELAKSYAPESSGKLRRSIKATVITGPDGRSVVRVGSKNRYAKFVEKGTSPHIIRARRKKFMVFPGTNSSSGRTIRAKIVYHPGTPPTNFLKRAVRNSRNRV